MGDTPAALRFVPSSFLGQWQFNLLGRPLLARAFHSLASAPADASPAERHAMQSAWAQRILSHLRVRLAIHWPCERLREPAIIVALHESVVDALCLLRLGVPMRFAARQEIFTWPGIGPALARMRHVAIYPERGAIAYCTMWRAAQEAVTAGESFAVFPQGTLLGIEAAFKSGAFRLARALGLPLQPIVITGSHRVWEHPFSPLLRYGQEVAIDVLAPIEAREVAATDCEIMCRRVEQLMKAAALEQGRPAPRRYQPRRDGFWDGYAFDIDRDFPEVRAMVAAHRGSVIGSNRSETPFMQ